MKKLILSIVASVFITASAYAEVIVGISGAAMGVKTTGSETLKSSSLVTSTHEKAVAFVPSVFLEYKSPFAGIAIGVDYVPASAKIGARTKRKVDTDVDDSSDTAGDNKASAELSDHATLYVSVPVFTTGAYLKAGVGQVDVDTTESLATGTSYGNASIDFATFGLGYEAEMGAGVLIRSEIGYTDYDNATITGAADADGVSNKITADTEAISFRISIAKSF